MLIELFSKKQFLNLCTMLNKMRLTYRNAVAIFLPIALFIVCTAMPAVSFAQAGFETTDGGDGTGVTDSPIDGGVVWLIIAGVAFGVYAIYRQQKKRVALG